MMKRTLLLLSLVFLGLSALQAQNTCTEQLKLTQRSFDDGQLDDIPLLLADCMKNGFTKEEKANAYKLLIQTYLFSEQYQKADEVMIKFLNEFPSYKIAVNDPKEFINLHSTYRTNSIFKIEIMAGVNLCLPVVVQHYGTYSTLTNKPTYKSTVGYTFEINYIDNLYKDFNYSIGVAVTLSNLDFSDKPDETSSLTGLYKNTYIGLPMAIRYNYKINKLNLFTKVGFEPVYLIQSSVDLTRTFKIAGQEPVTGTENLLSTHRKFDLRPLIALGTTINIGRDQIRLSAGYKFSSRSQLDPGQLYFNENLYSKYRFVEDDMLLNQAFLSVSYIRSIYKPKKIN